MEGSLADVFPPNPLLKYITEEVHKNVEKRRDISGKVVKMLEKELMAVDGETLWDLEFSAQRFCVRGLLPQGLCILGGAPKIGKSWLVLDWCVRIARGEAIWELDTVQGTTLYLCLEDTLQRVQHRLYCMSEEAAPNAYFATTVGTLADDLEKQISSFLLSHPDTVLVVVDTFQMVRGNAGDPSYGSDYQDMQKLKRIADQHGITILLVHHLRKQSDRDPVNRLSGTTGISGAVDAVFVLDKKERSQNVALLVCTGRDIEYRELELRFSKERCVWDLVSDSAEHPEQLLPKELNAFLEYMKGVKHYAGGNTELAESFTTSSGCAVEPKRLKQLMNCSKEALRELGLTFHSYRSNGQRLVEVSYTEPVTQVPQVTQKTDP